MDQTVFHRVWTLWFQLWSTVHCHCSLYNVALYSVYLLFTVWTSCIISTDKLCHFFIKLWRELNKFHSIFYVIQFKIVTILKKNFKLVYFYNTTHCIVYLHYKYQIKYCNSHTGILTGFVLVYFCNIRKIYIHMYTLSTSHTVLLCLQYIMNKDNILITFCRCWLPCSIWTGYFYPWQADLSQMEALWVFFFLNPPIF